MTYQKALKLLGLSDVDPAVFFNDFDVFYFIVESVKSHRNTARRENAENIKGYDLPSEFIQTHFVRVKFLVSDVFWVMSSAVVNIKYFCCLPKGLIKQNKVWCEQVKADFGFHYLLKDWVPTVPFPPVLETNVPQHFSQYITVWQFQCKLIHYFRMHSLQGDAHTHKEKKKQDYRRKRKAITAWWLTRAKRCKENADWGILWEFLFPRRCG